MSRSEPADRSSPPRSGSSGVALVTGGNGFIGSHLIRRLEAEGWSVAATSRSPRPSSERVQWLQADMADPARAREAFAEVKPTVVYHLAGAVGAGPGAELVAPTFTSLLESTVNVLLCANEHSCSRVVLAGSFTEPTAGDAWPVPGSPYAAAKWAASGYGRMFHALYGLPVVILRPFMAYGPGQAPTKLLPSVVTALLKGEAPKLSSGRTQADWVYIDDVIDAFVAAATADGVAGATLDLGCGRLTSIREVVERLHAIVGGKVAPLFGALPDRPRELEVVADTKAAADVLGWTARTSLDEGLRATVAAARAALTKEAT